MAATSSLTLQKVRGRILFSVDSRNQRSTKFKQDAQAV